MSRVIVALGTSSVSAAFVNVPASTTRTKAFIAVMRSMIPAPIDEQAIITPHPAGPLGAAVRAAQDRHDAEALLGMPESGRLAGEDHVGTQCELEATAEAQTLHRGDDRHRDALEAVEHRHVVLEKRAQFQHA